LPHASRYQHFYVEVFNKHEPLIDLFEAFGFQKSSYQTSRDELILAKNLAHPTDSSKYSPLEFYVLFGPPAIQTTMRSFIVPIIRSADPQEIMTYVGRRTVYRPDEIVMMCRSVRGVLAILFRQDRFVESPWQLDELQGNGVLRGWPQTIVRVGEKGCIWVRQQLDG
jgi:hypothetical protein